jgi:hypothetical protein
MRGKLEAAFPNDQSLRVSWRGSRRRIARMRSVTRVPAQRLIVAGLPPSPRCKEWPLGPTAHEQSRTWGRPLEPEVLLAEHEESPHLAAQSQIQPGHSKSVQEIRKRLGKHTLP